MPHSTLVVASLVTESADVQAVAQYVMDEIDELLDEGQVPSHVISFLTRIRTVMATVDNQFS